jgi:hypothetical protein
MVHPAMKSGAHERGRSQGSEELHNPLLGRVQHIHQTGGLLHRDDHGFPGFASASSRPTGTGVIVEYKRGMGHD